ncbi:hypothetical protein LJR219_002832 [Phenylobacterium sp. LjRoot219]|uniref:CC_3452 family protein n=1 Tax=Phenylobacterium sp. LjRoot219 TaxID=3342283 RepID=UPI003ECFF03D
MKLRLTAALVAIAAGAFATGAMAEPVVAKLQTPGSGAAKPVAGGAVFECLGDVCAARAPSADTASLRGCKDLARQMGAVNSFGPPSKPLSGDQVSACNESARK